MNTAFPEPQAPNTLIHNAIPTNNSTSAVAVDSSEIQIDPTTHLPFLKNVHFNDFAIADKLKSRLAAAGFQTPTPVQAKA